MAEEKAAEVAAQEQAEGQSLNAATDEPPSYSSLFGEMIAAKQQSSGMLDFVEKFFGIIFASVGFFVFLALLLAIPIASIIIVMGMTDEENFDGSSSRLGSSTGGDDYGTRYKDDCPVQKYIPIYLIVAGAFGLFRSLLGMCHQGRKTHKKRTGEDVEEERSKERKGFEGIIDCFMLAWFICGNIWIYGNYKPNLTDATHPKYCNQTLYLFAFWLTTVTYIAVAVACCCGFCFVGLAAAFS